MTRFAWSKKAGTHLFLRPTLEWLEDRLVPAPLAPNAVLGSSLYPGFYAHTFTNSDDGSVGPIALGFDLNFYGNIYNGSQAKLYVNNNGNVTFEAAQSTYTPFNLITTHTKIIAPFFADVDTRGDTSHGIVYYGNNQVGGYNAFAVTWQNVGYYNDHKDKTDTFQLVLIDREDTGSGNFDLEFNYGQIQWETGDASGGSGGFAGSNGSPPRAGYSNGSTASTELTGSGSAGYFLDSSATGLIHHVDENQVVGRFDFYGRDGTIVDTQPPVIVASNSQPVVDAGQLLQFTVSASNPNPGGGAVSLSAANLPAGATFNAVEGSSSTYLFSWQNPQTTSVTFHAVDASVSPPLTTDLVVPITVNPALSIAPASLPVATVGAAYSQTITVSGGTNAHTSFDTSGFSGHGTGLSATINGNSIVVSGTPTATGTATFTVLASDTTGASLSPASYSIVVGPATPTVHVSEAGGPFTYTGSAFPATATVAGVIPGVDNTASASLERVSPTLTYYAGTSASGPPFPGAPSLAGTYTVVAYFPGSTDYSSASAQTTFTINKAPSTTVVTINGGPFTYTGSTQTPATVSVTGAGGLSLTPGPLYDNNVNAGTATASYSYAGDANHFGSSDSKNFAIGKASSTTVVTIGEGPFTYTGSAQTPATVSVTGAGGLSLTPDAVYENNVNAGTATASYTYAGDANHFGSSDSKNFAIGKASSATVVTINGGPFTYTGSALTPATVSVTGAGGLSLTPGALYDNNVNAGTATASYSYAGDANHFGSSDSKNFAIGKASSTTLVTIAGGPFTYTGSAQTPATVSVTGAGGLSLTPVALYENNVNAGTAIASYSYAGDANHFGSSDSRNFDIGKASSTTVVTIGEGPFTYTGSAQTPATVSVTGAGGLSLTPDALYDNNVNAGTATASYSYAGDANHFGSSDSKNFAIGKASSATVVTINGGPFTYTGSALTPATVSVTGAGGLSLTPGPLYDNNVNAGTATASYTYAGDANHFGSSDSKNFDIGKASSTTVVTIGEGPFTYTGSAQAPATVSVTGAGGLSLTPDALYDNNVNAGTATASYSYAGDANHFGSSDSRNFDIGKASSTTVVTIGEGPFTYTGSAQIPATVSVTGAGGLSLTPDAVYENNVNAGTATASYTYAGDANHFGSSDSRNFDIGKASSTTVVTIGEGPFTYTGSAQTPATVSVTGAGGLSLTPDALYDNNVNAGTATASYSYAGDANHFGSSDSRNFDIGKASSTTVVTINGGPFTYTGSAQTPATVSVTGAGGLSLTPDAVYDSNVNPGTATASYSYAGDANHFGSSDSQTFTINPPLTITPALPDATEATPYSQSLTVSGGSGPYTTFAVTDFADGGTGLTASQITADAASGTIAINGTPNTFGTVTFTVNVTDSAGAQLSKTFTLKVADVAPTFGAAPAGTASSKSPYVGPINFSDPGNDTWKITVEYINAVNASDDTTETFTIQDQQGTPPFPLTHSLLLSHLFANDNPYTVKVTIFDGSATVTQAFPVNVTLGDVSTIQTTTVAPGQATTITLVDPTTGTTGTIQINRSADDSGSGSAALAFYGSNPTGVTLGGSSSATYADVQTSGLTAKDQIVLTVQPTQGNGVYQLSYFDAAAGQWKTLSAFIPLQNGVLTINIPASLTNHTVFAVSLASPVVAPTSVTPPVAQAATSAPGTGAVSDSGSSTGGPTILTFTSRTQLTVTVTAAGDRGSSDSKPSDKIDVEQAWREMFGEEGDSRRMPDQPGKSEIKPAAGPEDDEVWYKDLSIFQQTSARAIQLLDWAHEPAQVPAAAPVSIAHTEPPAMLMTEPDREKEAISGVALSLVALSPYLLPRHRGRNRRWPKLADR